MQFLKWRHSVKKKLALLVFFLLLVVNGSVSILLFIAYRSWIGVLNVFWLNALLELFGIDLSGAAEGLSINFNGLGILVAVLGTIGTLAMHYGLARVIAGFISRRGGSGVINSVN